MAHPLDGCRAKIKRAGQHLREFQSETDAWLKAHPYGFRHERKRDAEGWDRFRVFAVAKAREEPPPPILGVLVGDVAHNLRSALDHLVCELASGPCDRTQFPICDQDGYWPIEIKKGRLAGLTDFDRTLIERVQPYHGRDIGRALRALRELSDGDKHRILAPMVAASPHRAPVFSPPAAIIATDIPDFGWVGVKHDAEVARFGVKLHPLVVTPVDVDLTRPYTVVIGERYPITIADFVGLRDKIRRLIYRIWTNSERAHLERPSG